MGPAKSGKSAIISQFLKGVFPTRHKVTQHEIYEERVAICFNLTIEDMGAAFAGDHQEIFHESINKSNIVIVVFSLDDSDSLKAAADLRDQVEVFSR